MIQRAIENTGVGTSDFAGLVCPYCYHELVFLEDRLLCKACEKHYPVTGGIPDFRARDEYWCNVQRETMQKLNSRARESGDWLAAAKEFIPQYLAHVESFDRADAQLLWPEISRWRILDAGSMWGGITIPVAQNCREIFAVDKTIETLELLRIRAEQMGFGNIRVAASTLRRLPFSDSYFDMVILSGVLEWVAFEQDLALDIHWGKRRNDSPVYTENPQKVQLQVLGELRRVLKPGGYLHLAIENRFGYQYLGGWPDDHVNIKYVSLLPRFMANIITRYRLNCDYRTYVYSLLGYRSLLKKSGFGDMEFYGAFDHYILPRYIVPTTLLKHWKHKVLPINSPLAPGYAKIAARAFPAGLLKHVAPSFIALARKDGDKRQGEDEARVVQLLRKACLLPSPGERMEVAKYDGRQGNYYTANFLVYRENDATPAYFCKICRDNKHTDVLRDEADNLKAANELLMNTVICSSLPRLLCFGTIDNLTFLVTQFMEGETSRFDPGTSLVRNNLRNLDESVQSGVKFLTKFQECTRVREVEVATYLPSVIERQREILKNMGQLTEELDGLIRKLILEVTGLGALVVPICAVHGDYDFFENILFDGNDVRVVDFEHFETEGLPFLDLASLIFNPILMNRRLVEPDVPLPVFVDKYGLRQYIAKWLNLYAELSGISAEVLRFLAPIAALEQKTKTYPYYRDPATFPMNSGFTELVSYGTEWRK